LRHLAKHGSVFKPNPSGRSKRACITCHAGKIKCDGNEKCSTCLKKGLECKYRTQDEIQSSASTPERGEQMAWQDSTSPSAKEHERSSTSNTDTGTSGNSSQIQPVSEGAATGTSTTSSNLKPFPFTSPSLFRAPNVNGLVDWSAVKIRTHADGQNHSPTLDADLDIQPDAESERYLELYYLHFHHRWPIVHRPSLDDEAPVTIVLSSMTLIGAWLEGSLEGKKRALNSHDKLVSNIASQLVRSKSNKSIRK
jgi:hypothetical protein